MLMQFGREECLSAKIILEILFNFKIRLIVFFFEIENEVFEVRLNKSGPTFCHIV